MPTATHESNRSSQEPFTSTRSSFSSSSDEELQSPIKAPSVHSQAQSYHPSLFAHNDDNSHTDASDLLLVSEGGDLLQTELDPDGELTRDVTGGECARKATEKRRKMEMQYAWSVPLEELYSILVYAPSLGQWYGSVTIK